MASHVSHWMLLVGRSMCVCLCVPSRHRIKESSGWQQVFSSPYLNWTIERIALNAKVVGGPHGDKDKMVAAASESSIILWSIQDGGSGNEIGKPRTFQRVGSEIIPTRPTWSLG